MPQSELSGETIAFLISIAISLVFAAFAVWLAIYGGPIKWFDKKRRGQ